MGQFLIWSIVVTAMGLINTLIVENTHRGIVFTKTGGARLINGHWKICYHYNLTEYYQEIKEFRLTLNQMELICEKLSDHNCGVVTKFFNSEYQRMQYDMDLLDINKKISKREAPLAFIGKLDHDLFGLVDEESAKSYENKINELILSINEQHTLDANQTTFVKKSLITTQQVTENLQKNLNKLYIAFKSTALGLNTSLSTESLKIELNSLTNIASLIVLEHRGITEKIVHKNPADLIDFNTINDDFRHIRDKLGHDHMLPIKIKTRGDVYKTLRISTSGVKISRSALLLEINIPLVENKKYELFESTPIPIIHDGAMFGIKTVQKYILANMNIKEYVEISENELNKCHEIEMYERICQTTAPIVVNDFNTCEADILFGDGSELPKSCILKKINNATYISELNKSGIYVVTPNGQTKVRTICNETRVAVETIDKQIMISPEPDCVVKIAKYRLRENKMYLTNHSLARNFETYMGGVEITNTTSVFLTGNVSEIKIMQSSEDFENLIREAEIIENREKHIVKIDKLESDSSLHSISLFGLSTTTVIIIALIIYITVTVICPMATNIARLAAQAR